MAEIPRQARIHGKIQVVESSLPPATRKKRAKPRRRRLHGSRGNNNNDEENSNNSANTLGNTGPAIPGGVSVGETAPEIVLVDKQSICVDILSNGYVQSFVDFFYLTHRPDPVQDAYNVGQPPAEIDVSIEDMEVIQKHLVDAEAARRQPDKVDEVYSNLNELATHFQARNDQRTGIYFYEKCLEIARIMQDAPGEMKATSDLGNAYQEMKDYLKAAEYQEQHLALAQANVATAPEQIDVAYAELKKTYTAYGELMEEEGHVQEAIEYHKKCLVAAQQTADKAAEASAHYRLGRALVLSDSDGHGALGKTHLSKSLELCNELGDIRGQGLAFSTLAALSQKSGGSSEEAVEHLKNFLRVSESTGNVQAQAEACHNLGAIYNREGRFDKAVECFEQNFRLCRKLVKEGGAKTSLVDKARMNLGMAKGNLRLGKFMNVIYADLKSLLFWKNSRQDIQ